MEILVFGYGHKTHKKRHFSKFEAKSTVSLQLS